MGFALLPRIHFQGDFETDVCTANNDDVVHAIDQVAVAVRFGQNASSTPGTPDPVPATDAEFIQWMRSTTGTPTEPRIRSGWNYYGDNSCRFNNCKVVSIDVGAGVVTTPGADAVIGGSVLLGENAQTKNGIMVDLNPEGTWGTQIFADGFQVKAGAVLLTGRPTIACSRWLHFGRNMAVQGFGSAAATWQSVLPKASLRITAGATGALADLYNAAQTHDGIVVRYCTYLLASRIDTGALLKAYRRGDAPHNPAIGIVLGSMGVWDASEFQSMPGGRLLSPRQDLNWDHNAAPYGPVTVSVDEGRHRAVIDLITAVPEVDDQGTKADVGPASLIAIPDGGTPIELGRFRYDRAAYATGGGIQEMAMTPEQTAAALSGSLGIAFGDTVVYQEEDYALDTDDRNIYLDTGDERQVRLRLRFRGKVPAAPATIQISQQFNPLGKMRSGPKPAADRAVSHPETVTTDAHGEVSFTIKATKAMLGFLHCQVQDAPKISGSLPTLGCLVNFRVFPADNYDHIPDDQLTFDLIYQEVLRYYHVLYPAMTGVFSLADEQQVKDAAAPILARIKASNWASWSHMPRTREMSAGKQRLLKRWLEKIPQ